MTLFMVQNNLTEQDIYDKGDVLDFPQSVVEFFEGRIGIPYQGFPEKLQKIILKGKKPLTERPGKSLAPVDFDAVRANWLKTATTRSRRYQCLLPVSESLRRLQ